MVKIKKYDLQKLQSTFRMMTDEELSAYVGTGWIYKFDNRGKLVGSVFSDEIETNAVQIVSQSKKGEKILNAMTTRCDLTIASYTTQYNEVGHSISGGDLDLFWFMVDYTKVEWGAFYNGGAGAPGSTPCLLQTTHDEYEADSVLTKDDLKKYDTYVHSHPNDGQELKPSGTDKNTFDNLGLDKDCSLVNFGIIRQGRARGGEHVQWQSNGDYVKAKGH